MSKMEITTKIGCNNACVYCPQDRLIGAYTKRSNILQMSFDVFKACVDKIPLNVNINFSGMGEPWLNPECTKMLLYAHKRGYKISAFTTLVGMNFSDINLLESVPFESFFIHLPSNKANERIKVDENYLNLLNKISKSNIKINYLFHGERVHSKVKLLLIERNIEQWPIYTRAGNVKVENRPTPIRKRGVIGCSRNLRHNILLPNGDVILCCMDFGIQHVLGNLISSDYDSLFCNKEFLKIKKGLRDESLDILCRYCDIFAYNVNLFAKVYNSFWCQLKNTRNLSDLRQLVQKAILKLKELGHFVH